MESTADRTLRPSEREALAVTWLGHSTVLIELDGVRLLTDPVLGARVGPLRRVAPPVPAGATRAVDAVLLSHLHADHADRRSLRMLDPGTPVIAPVGAARWLSRRGLRTVRELRPGEEASVGGVRVRATSANHPPGRWRERTGIAPVGFVASASQAVYFAGDTDLFAGMSALAGSIDLALLPVSGWGPTLGPGHLDPARARSPEGPDDRRVDARPQSDDGARLGPGLQGRHRGGAHRCLAPHRSSAAVRTWTWTPTSSSSRSTARSCTRSSSPNSRRAVRARTRPRPAAWSAAAAPSRGARRARVAPARVRPAPRSGPAAARLRPQPPSLRRQGQPQGPSRRAAQRALGARRARNNPRRGRVVLRPPSTAKAADLLDSHRGGAVLVALHEDELAAAKSFRNLARVYVLHVEDVGVADLVRAATLVLSQAALDNLTTRARRKAQS